MFKRFPIFLSFIILSISSVYCYIYDGNYSIVCFSYTNANGESISDEGCLSQYGDGYYCCGTCKNRTCCNHTAQFLTQKNCRIKFGKKNFFINSLLPAIIFSCVCISAIFCTIIKKKCFRKYSEIRANQRRNPIEISRRISSPRLNSIQLDSLPPAYDIVKDIDPNLPSYESILSNKKTKFKTTQV